MAECEQAWSDGEQPLVPVIWNTAEVGREEAFDYYREGICRSFMPLRPELDRARRRDFSARVRSYRLDRTTLNVVSARSHTVNRGRAEIAASPEACFYLNFQIRGECRIIQKGRTVALRPGDVGIFDSDAGFVLDHGRRPDLAVASLMVPRRYIVDELGLDPPGEPIYLSRHPVYGHLLAEAMRTHAENADWTSAAEAERQRRLILSLAGMAMCGEDRLPGHENRRAAQLHRIKAIIRVRCHERGFDAGDCAAEAGLSARYVHKLFQEDGDRFGAFVQRERLRIAARRLRDPAHLHRPVADIALSAGFADVSHFSRAFRAEFGQSPGAWRRQ